MAKQFNKFLYYGRLLIYLIDSELSFKFNKNKNKNRGSGLPVELEKLSKEDYYETARRINKFSLNVRNHEEATLKLTATDINNLKIYRYENYAQDSDDISLFQLLDFAKLRITPILT